jgi:RNA polymerase sigma-70 factor (ECF subfamily)
MSEVEAAVTKVFREEWGRIVATLIRMTGDWDLAEECAQDAVARALERWPRDGVPRRPGAWLTTTARNHAVNRLRRTATETAKLREVAALTYRDEVHVDEPGGVPDDRLRLIFTCCHPALPLDGRVALTLRTLLGLSTAEIARAFLSGCLRHTWGTAGQWPRCSTRSARCSTSTRSATRSRGARPRPGRCRRTGSGAETGTA